ncbi:hypothetical protein [Prosthecobacter sp.]|uniref:hypothetical protein n=1 Tax=Prosthecobacter sp. TaxID=1965333 RepID=UPI003784C2F0
MEELNPYAAPQSEAYYDNTNASHVRQAFLRTESHLKALGLLVMVRSLTSLVINLVMMRMLLQEYGMVVLPWPFIVLGSLLCVAGAGLYFLRRWAGLLTNVLAFLVIVIAFNQLPAGWIAIVFQACVLAFLRSARARVVLSHEYQAAILRTPMIRSRPAAWLVPAVVVVVLVNVVLAMR